MSAGAKKTVEEKTRSSGGHKKRSLLMTFTSSVLALETILIFCATLASWGLMQGFFNREGHHYSVLTANKDLRPLVLAVGFLSVLLLSSAIITLRRTWGILYGWALQIVVIAFGIILIPMFILGAFFTGMWWYAVRTGRRLDRENAERELPNA